MVSVGEHGTCTRRRSAHRRQSPRRGAWTRQRSVPSILVVSTQDPTRLGGAGEIAEDEATGDVAAAYEQVRSMLGVPFVPTIYRMAALHEDVFLEAVARLAPVVVVEREKGFVQQAEDAARQALETTSESRAGLGLDSWTLRLIERYSTANPLNLLFALGLLGLDGMAWPSVMSPPLPARSGDAHMDIRRCHGDVTVPGFWRELGERPAVLDPLWSATRQHAERGGFDAARRAVSELAAETIRGAGVDAHLSDLPPAEAEQIRRLLGWFPTGIATMVVETAWLTSHTRRAPHAAT